MNITIKYNGRSQVFTLADGINVAAALNDGTVRGALGYGTSVEGHLDGVPQKADITLREGDYLVVYDKQCGKANDDVEHVAIHANGGVTVEIIYGSGRATTEEFPEGTTLAEVLANPEIKGKLGLGASVEGHIGGVPQKPETVIADGDVVKVYDRQCSKAVR